MDKQEIKVTLGVGLNNTELPILQEMEKRLDDAMEGIGYHRTVATKGGDNAEIKFMPAKVTLPHQQRVIDEKAGLDGKIAALMSFSAGGLGCIFKNLPEAEKERLNRQLVVMLDYSELLGERIAAF